jgi:hypothetical protein
MQVLGAEGVMKTCIRCEMTLPFAAFTPHVRGRDGLQAACKACEVERLQLRKHDLTSLEKTQIADAQNGCATCGRLEPGAKGWVVDHDRSCCPADKSCPDCRRGVLCQWCNSALGYAGDDPQRLRRMADYIEAGTRLSPLNRQLSQSSDSYGRDGRTDGDVLTLIDQVAFQHARRGGNP